MIGERPDTPDTQTAAPPVVPPKRPIVGAAMADDPAPLDFHAMQRACARRTAQLQALKREIDALLTRRAR
jgi:hypothetical protein